MFLMLLLGYVTLMTTLAIVLVVQELLILAADEQALAQLRNPKTKEALSGEQFISKLKVATSDAKELRARLALEPFPLRAYTDIPEERQRLNEILAHLRTRIFGKENPK